MGMVKSKVKQSLGMLYPFLVLLNNAFSLGHPTLPCGKHYIYMSL